MKAKVLISYYSDGSCHDAHRVYLEKDYEQAEKDLALVIIDGCKNWELSECELFNSPSDSIIEIKIDSKAVDEFKNKIDKFEKDLSEFYKMYSNDEKEEDLPIEVLKELSDSVQNKKRKLYAEFIKEFSECPF